MKTFKLLVLILFFSGSTFGTLIAQDKGKDKSSKDKDTELQQAIEEQKRALKDQQDAMEEQSKAQDEANQELEKSARELDKLNNMHFNFSTDGKNNMRIFRSRNGIPEPPMVIGPDGFSWNSFGDSEGTSWEFSKSMKENTFKRDYSFDVEKTVHNVVLSVSGDCKEGTINIKVITPEGKNFSDIVIDEFGNLNWRKSFNVSDKENQDKTGEWKFQINSNKATGYFRISLQTY